MSEDDPDNELGHFSLGRAYLDEQMPEAAIAPLRRAIAVNPRNSKTYQLLATALLALDRRDEAIEMLTKGVTIAHERGDMMPKNAMLAMLKELNAAVPEFAGPAAPEVPVGEGQIQCR